MTIALMRMTSIDSVIRAEGDPLSVSRLSLYGNRVIESAARTFSGCILQLSFEAVNSADGGAGSKLSFKVQL
jgi:hypothetical protein